MELPKLTQTAVRQLASAQSFARGQEYYAGGAVQNIERVADAAVTSHSDWVIDVCRQQAEEIMNNGRSSLYLQAANWLRKAKAAYLATGRLVDWYSYLDGLLKTHSRKRSLVPQLKSIG